MTDDPQANDPQATAQLLQALTDALLADEVTPAAVAALFCGAATPAPDGDGHALVLPPLPGVDARLRLAHEQAGPRAATSLSLRPSAPGGGLPLGRADLEAAFGPGRDGVPMPIERFGARPGPIGVQGDAHFEYAAPNGRAADVSVALVKLFGQPERLTALTLSRRPAPGGPRPAPKKGLFGWLRR